MPLRTLEDSVCVDTVLQSSRAHTSERNCQLEVEGGAFNRLRDHQAVLCSSGMTLPSYPQCSDSPRCSRHLPHPPFLSSHPSTWHSGISCQNRTWPGCCGPRGPQGGRASLPSDPNTGLQRPSFCSYSLISPWLGTFWNSNSLTQLILWGLRPG